MIDLTAAKMLSLKTLAFVVLLVFLLCTSNNYFGGANPGLETVQAAAQAASVQTYRELIELSQKEKKGLTFFVRGQMIGGAVVRMIGNDAVEVRSQAYSRVIIRLDSVDAVAIN